MAAFTFPERYSLSQIKNSVRAGSPVLLPDGEVDWKRSAFAVFVDGTASTITPADLVNALTRRNVSIADISSILAQKGFDEIPPEEILAESASGGMSFDNFGEADDDVATEQSARQQPARRNMPSEEFNEDRDEAVRQRQYEVAERAALQVKLELKKELSLDDQEFDRLPSLNYLPKVLQSLALSFAQRMFIASKVQLATTDGPFAKLKDGPGYESYLIMHDAIRWTDKLTHWLTGVAINSGRIPAPPVRERNTEITAAYKKLLSDLVYHWRGFSIANPFITELDRRLSSPEEALEIETEKTSTMKLGFLPEEKPREPETGPQNTTGQMALDL